MLIRTHFVSSDIDSLRTYSKVRASSSMPGRSRSRRRRRRSPSSSQTRFSRSPSRRPRGRSPSRRPRGPAHEERGGSEDPYHVKELLSVFSTHAGEWSSAARVSAAEKLAKGGIERLCQLKAAPRELILHCCPPDTASRELTLCFHVQGELQKFDDKSSRERRKKPDFDASKCLETYGLQNLSHEHQLPCKALQRLVDAAKEAHDPFDFR